jgi:hypothetical protein
MRLTSADDSQSQVEKTMSYSNFPELQERVAGLDPSPAIRDYRRR